MDLKQNTITSNYSQIGSSNAAAAVAAVETTVTTTTATTATTATTTTTTATTTTSTTSTTTSTSTSTTSTTTTSTTSTSTSSTTTSTTSTTTTSTSSTSTSSTSTTSKTTTTSTATSTTSTSTTSTTSKTTTTTMSTRTTSTATTTTTSTTSSTSTSSTSAVDPCSFQWDKNGTVILGNGSAGSGTNQLNNPYGIYIDSNDILYVTDCGNNRIQQMILSSGVVTTIAGNGIAGNSSTQFDVPEFAFVDGNQNLYVPDYYNYRIQKFSSGSLIGQTIAGTGTLGNATNQFNGLKNLWLDSSYQYLYQVEIVNNRVMKFSTNSTNGTAGIIVAGGTGVGNNANQLNNPQGIYYDTSSNSMYIANSGGNTIMQWTPSASSGLFVAGISGQYGSNSSLLNNPIDVRVDQYQNIYVADSGNYRIQMFCTNGGNQGITIAGGYGPGTTNIQLGFPRSLQFDSQMNLYVSDSGNNRIIKFNKL